MKSIPMCDAMILAFRNCKPGVWPAQPIDPAKPWKSQTRRIIKPQPPEGWGGTSNLYALAQHAPLGVPGGVLRVREAIAAATIECGERPHSKFKDIAVYSVDGQDVVPVVGMPRMPWRWKVKRLPARFCPNDAVREHAKLMRVRVERVQEITERDSEAEGMMAFGGMSPAGDKHKYSFIDFWDSLYAKRGFGWDANPWVFAYDIMRCGDAE